MKFQVTPYHFEELIKKSYSLDLIYLLKLIEEQFDIHPLCSTSMKIDALHQGLKRKGLITEDGVVSVSGKELLAFMETKEATKIIKKKSATTEFEEWWQAYPGTDTFECNGKKFKGNRSLRINRDKCRLEFDKILNEGIHTASQLTAALKFDVEQKISASMISRANKLTYMQNSLTYLNQKSYEPFIELINKGETVNKPSIIARGTDI